MLRSLLIQNYALIEQSDIEFDNGFSVITGETGAGKSILLGAVGLLLGQRADVSSIKKGAKRCVIEAHFTVPDNELTSFFEENNFDFDGDECILRREMHANGKTRAFINDTPAPLTLMRSLGERLIDVHSQHQNLLLNQEDFQLHVIDVIAHDGEELADYKKTFKQYLHAKSELNELKANAEKSKTEEDYIRFQLEQLENAALTSGEDQHLAQESDTLSHAEEIKSGLFSVTQIMDGEDEGVLQALKSSASTLHGLLQMYPTSADWHERIQSAYIDLKDLNQDIESKLEDIDFDPARFEEVNNRLNLIYSLEQKYQATNVDELLALQDKFKEQLKEITSFDDRIDEMVKQTDTLLGEVRSKAERLSAKRKKAALEIEKDMRAKLLPLGMPYVQFNVQLDKRKAPEADGIDGVTFLFSANKNDDLRSLAAVASGGEIARVMLAIKALIAGATHLPTIIFDEIDTGVSGAIAARMAEIMGNMSKVMQVISITHLPQIAARGKTHYKVYKIDNEESTVSHIKRLNSTERVEEIAHMLSGEALTTAAIDNARDLLKNYEM
jgi:DNA repair protein RecN (Recombination protein N)